MPYNFYCFLAHSPWLGGITIEILIILVYVLTNRLYSKCAFKIIFTRNLLKVNRQRNILTYTTIDVQRESKEDVHYERNSNNDQI